VNVKGAILAGGYGKRLRPITTFYPKALIKIKGDYTILEKQLNDLRFSGIDSVYLLVGYLHQKIINKFGNSWKGIKLEYLIEEKPAGTHYAIKNALEQAQNDLVVLNGDVVCDFNIKSFIEYANRRKELITIAVTQMQSPYGIVTIEENKIVNFIEKPKLPHYINAGIYYIKRDAIDYFKREYHYNDVERTVFPSAALEGQIACYKEDSFWISIDSIKDVESVREIYKNREDKPWGWENIVVSNEKYLVKELYLKGGYRTSIHYHEEKDETLNVIRGSAYVEFFDEKLNLLKKVSLFKGSTVRILPKTIHSIVGVENALLQEFSTPHINDVVRVKDFYNR